MPGFPSRRKLLVFMACMALAFALTGTGGRALAMDKSDTAHLESMFKDALARYKDGAARRGSTLQTEGDVTVTPAEGYYAVTLPHLTLISSGGERVEIGIVAINAIKDKKPDQWKMTVALPTPIIGYSADGNISTITKIGAQNFAGVWNEKMRSFIMMDARYKDISITTKNEGIAVKIPEIAVSGNLNETKPGLLSGPMNFVLTGLSATFDDDGSLLTVGKISLNSGIKDYALDAVAAFEEKMEAIEALQKQGHEKDASKAHAQALYNMVSEFMTSAWDGVSFSATLENATLTQAAGAGQRDTKFGLDSAGFGLELNGFRSNNVSMHLTWQYKNLKILPTPPEFMETAPTNMNVDVSLNQLPLREMLDLGKSALHASLATPEAGNLVLLQTAMTLPQMLTKAQVNASVNDISVGNENYQANMTGRFVANLNALRGFTGTLHAEITGLDYLIMSLNSRVKKIAPDSPRRDNIMNMLNSLNALQSNGRVEQSSAKKWIYDFELNEKGETLLNGKDMGALLPGRETSPAPGAPASPTSVMPPAATPKSR